MSTRWKEMLAEFTALGGVAENVAPGRGARGLGLFAIDPSKPVRIFVPKHLLIEVSEINFENERFKVNRPNERERIFLETFENEFSWGADGRRDAGRKVTAARAIPSEVSNMLAAEFGFEEVLMADFETATQEKFVSSRKIKTKDGDTCLMPILELLNHDPHAQSFSVKDGIAVSGKFEGEVLVSYAMTDAMGIYHQWGFASDQRVAISLAGQIPFSDRLIAIQRKTNEHEKRGDFLLPKIFVDAERVELSYVPLGAKRFPRLSRGIFYQLMRDAGLQNYEELFDTILSLNTRKFLKLLASLEKHTGDEILELRKMAHFQLDALTYCVGSRDI